MWLLRTETSGQPYIMHVRNRYIDAVSSLINDHGADITAQNKFGQTPRDVAKEKNHQEIVRYLEFIENGDEES